MKFFSNILATPLFFALSFSLFFSIAWGNPLDWNEFLYEMEQEAQSLSFYYETQIKLYLSEDPEIIEELEKQNDLSDLKKNFEIFKEKKPKGLVQEEQKRIALEEKKITEKKTKITFANEMQNHFLFWTLIRELFQAAQKRAPDFQVKDKVLWVTLVKKEVLFLMSLSFNEVIDKIPYYVQTHFPNEVSAAGFEPCSTQAPSIQEAPNASQTVLFFTNFIKDELPNFKKSRSNPKDYILYLLKLFNSFQEEATSHGNRLFPESPADNKLYERALDGFSFFHALNDWISFFLEKNPAFQSEAFLENHLESFFTDDFLSDPRPFFETTLLWPLIYKTYDRFGLAFQHPEFSATEEAGKKEIQTLIKRRHLLKGHREEKKEIEKIDQAITGAIRKQDHLKGLVLREQALEKIPILPSGEAGIAFIQQGVVQFWSHFQKKGGGLRLASSQKKKKKKGNPGPTRLGKITTLLAPNEQETQKVALESLAPEEIPLDELLEETVDASQLDKQHSLRPLPLEAEEEESQAQLLDSKGPPESRKEPLQPKKSLVKTRSLSVPLHNSCSDLQKVISLGAGERVCQMSLGNASLITGEKRQRGPLSSKEFFNWVHLVWKALLPQASPQTQDSIQRHLKHFHPQGRTRFPLPLFTGDGSWSQEFRIYTLDLPHRSADPMPYLTLKHFLKAILKNAGFSQA